MNQHDESSSTPGSPPVFTKTAASLDSRRQQWRTIVAAALFLGALIVYVLSRVVPKVPEPLPDLLLALTAAMAIHLLDRIWLYKDTSEALDQLREEIVGNVARETRALIGQLDEHILDSIQKSIKSLEAMARRGLLQVYADRRDAADDIKQDLSFPETKKVRLIGISLNDFVLGSTSQSKLSQAWNTLKEFIEHGISQNRTLDIKVLLIDPTCLGAQLRSKGEERNGVFSGRLKRDVDMAISELRQLEQAKKHPGVALECKLYRLPPILFLCLTDSVCYVQQYYFWSSRDETKSFPIIRFQNVQTAGGVPSLHAELEKHFDWIWEKASVGLAEYKDEAALGVDKGVVQSGIVNVYTVPDDGLKRMLYLLRHAKERVSIQGNSLHSFFNNRPATTPLYQAIRKLLIEDRVAIDLLFLKPDSEQARYRAFREYSLNNQDLTREKYFSSEKIHSESVLYTETTVAKSTLSQLVKEVAAIKGPGWTPKLNAAFYSSAPYCFLLRVDNTVLIEQYHYGKLPDEELSGDRVVLGKEFPLIEYSSSPSDLFDLTNKTPFALLVNHLAFALQEAEPLQFVN